MNDASPTAYRQMDAEPALEPYPEVRTRSSRNRRALYMLVPLSLAGLLAIHLLQPAPPPPTPPLATVTTALPLAREVNQWDDYVGRFLPSKTVEVRPRVSGQIVTVNFHDGEVVHQGQLLFTIDRRPFLAALAEARADVASAQSTLDLARSDLARANRLTGDDAISGGEVDQLRARVRAGQAAVAAAQARLRQRSLDVDWTAVRAPISGRISDRRADIGNLVAGGQNGAGTLLTTINAVDPIYFAFDASEALFLKAQRDRRQGLGATIVQIRLQDEPDYRWTGKFDFTDNGLDPRSGTIRGRATVANPGAFLTPGLFGNMRLSSGGTVRALLVPDAAVQTDQTRKTVLVVGSDGVVIAKPVVLGPVVSGLRIVRSGLSSSDHVVIEGTQGAAPGAKVSAHAGRITPDAPSAMPNNASVASQATFAQ